MQTQMTMTKNAYEDKTTQLTTTDDNKDNND